MNFTKMQGLGNDFIVLAGLDSLPADAAEQAVRLCDRHFGIGADGLVYLLPSSKADYMMRIINSDGSEAEQCGNAIRCAATYLYENGLVDAAVRELTIETIGAGAQRTGLVVDKGRVASVRVDMGEPVLNGLAVPTTLDEAAIIEQPIAAGDREFRFTAVSMGNPHCVIFVEDARSAQLHAWGPELENHPYFPRRTNVEFASLRSRDYADMRVWERGAGPTLACGTGACATLVAGVLTGRMDRKGIVSLAGGELQIEWDEADNRVYMTGPARTVFKGTWTPQD
ncbi:diaminopimelate epimerase [Paenibacillus sp. UNCCL117]|uniref:diaminopimelate epimerase n=1 Tax=unclassified Paenibacillus TaxID=185978 RepID=UPI000890B167|nr:MULTISPECIES: diaminopimelate epimerase [unclassified Paenibacillus]SDD98729.1 diaminopimelate epimerase [Paenibacillus sp. cl123]SFW55886.1 diaminopimelate epimerase [Paenibacillus sp. UNCCL117]